MAEYVPAEQIDQGVLAAMLERTGRHDGYEVLSEHKALRVTGSDNSRAVALVAMDRISGYAQAAWHGPVDPDGEGHWAVEVVVDPESRSEEAVAGCVLAVRRRLPEGDRVAVWSSVEYVAAGLEAAGYSEVRRLLRMRRGLPARGTAEYPVGMALQSFVPGKDEDAWLALNNAAFAGHPENGALDHNDLQQRRALPWFDREGFLLAWDGGRLVGSCWTKMHDDGTGEIYIIAVHPEARGRGLGRALLMSGMDYLHRKRKAASVLLFVEADNDEALSLYELAGFGVDRIAKQYQLPAL
jgi:mycothiol synthase